MPRATGWPTIPQVFGYAGGRGAGCRAAGAPHAGPPDAGAPGAGPPDAPAPRTRPRTAPPRPGPPASAPALSYFALNRSGASVGLPPVGSFSLGQPFSTFVIAAFSSRVAHIPYFFFTATCRAT